MSVPKPTTWPTVFNYQTVSPIAAYLNEPIFAARKKLNLDRAAKGLPYILNEEDWDAEKLPIYPADGIRRLTGVPPFVIIGPSGIAGFGLHEFEGHWGEDDIHARLNEMQLLWRNSLTGTVSQPSQPPPTTEEPMPIDPNTGLPVGTPPTPPPPAEGGLPPGTPDPSSPPAGGGSTPPVMGTDLRLVNGKYNLTCRYDASERGAGAGPAQARKYSEQSGVFTFFSVDKWEVVVSYAQAAGGFMVSAMTDVNFVLTVKNLQNGETKTFENAAGNLLGKVITIS